MKLAEWKSVYMASADIDCSGSSAVEDAWFKVEGDVAWFYITYTSGARWAYCVPASVALAGVGMESVGRFVNLVLKPNATYTYELNTH